MISRQRILLVAGCILFLVSLHASYVWIIAPNFAYKGLVYNPPGILWNIVFWFLALLPATWMPFDNSRPSQSVYWILYLFVYIPAVVIPVYSLGQDVSVAITHSVFLLICFAMLAMIYKLPLFETVRTGLSPTLFWSAMLVFTAFAYVYIGLKANFSFELVSLADAYDVRADYRDTLSEGGRLLAYVVSWQGNVINPLFISKGLIDRRPWVIGIGLLGQLILFSLSGFKSILFSALFIMLLLVVLRGRNLKFGVRFVCALSAIIVVCALYDFWSDSFFMSSLFTRRMIVTPGFLSGAYHEFFSENPKVLLSHSLLSFLSEYPYALKPPLLIGQQYFGSSLTSANANLWADAYANFGYFGMIVFTGILGVVLWVFDSLARRIDPHLSVLLLGIPAIALSNSALLTSLLSHGLGLAILVVFLMPKAAVQREGEGK